MIAVVLGVILVILALALFVVCCCRQRFIAASPQAANITTRGSLKQTAKSESNVKLMNSSMNR